MKGNGLWIKPRGSALTFTRMGQPTKGIGIRTINQEKELINGLTVPTSKGIMKKERNTV